MNARSTPQIKAVIETLTLLGHATNAQILQLLKVNHPTLSPTTVHRITARLHERGEIGIAPPDEQGSMRYDISTETHDHFICTNCGGIRDLDVAKELIPKISKALGGCRINGRLVIRGSCEVCTNKLKGEVI